MDKPHKSLRVLTIAGLTALALVGGYAAQAQVVEPGVPMDPGSPVARTTYLKPQGNLAEPQPVAINSLVETSNPRRPYVTFWAGGSDCYGLDHVRVVESNTQVGVEVVVGLTVPPGTICTAIAQLYSTGLKLKAPVGNREVVSIGVPPPPPPAS